MGLNFSLVKNLWPDHLVGDVVECLGSRAFKEVGQPGIEEGVFHHEVVFDLFLGGVE